MKKMWSALNVEKGLNSACYFFVFGGAAQYKDLKKYVNIKSISLYQFGPLELRRNDFVEV